MPVYPGPPILRLPSGKDYPEREDDESQEDYIKRMWKLLGAEIAEMGPDKAKEHFRPISGE